MVKKKILVVSQEKYVQELLENALKEEGYDVLLTDTMDEAVRKSRQESPCLVLVDMVLSDIDRADVLRTFHRGKSPRFSIAKPSFPILVWSAYNSSGGELPESYFLKTPDFFKIRSKIKELCPTEVWP